MVSAITILENAEKNVEKKRGESKTYTEPLPENDPSVKSYLTSFYQERLVTNSFLREMREELRRYPETLGEHYKLLVPNIVSFDAFFSRYYYRCNIDRIVDELKNEDIKLSSSHDRRGLMRGSGSARLLLTRGSGSARFSTSGSSHMHNSRIAVSDTDSSSDVSDDDGFAFGEDDDNGI